MIGQLFMSAPFLVEEEDMTLAQRNTKKIARWTLFSLVGGFVINLPLKNIKGLNLLKRTFFLRMAIRLPVFALPFAGAYFFKQDLLNDTLNVADKYFRR